VVSAFYYLRIIKVMYFDEADETLDAMEGKAMKGILLVSSLAILVFILLPQTLAGYAATAAASLFAG